MNPELEALADIVETWIKPAPGATAYLFGSSIRGDRQPDSDLDIRLFLTDWKLRAATMASRLLKLVPPV